MQWYISPLFNASTLSVIAAIKQSNELSTSIAQDIIMPVTKFYINPLIISTIWSGYHNFSTELCFLWFSVFLQSTTIGICIHNAYTCNMSIVTFSLESLDAIAPPSLV